MSATVSSAAVVGPRKPELVDDDEDLEFEDNEEEKLINKPMFNLIDPTKDQ